VALFVIIHTENFQQLSLRALRTQVQVCIKERGGAPSSSDEWSVLEEAVTCWESMKVAAAAFLQGETLSRITNQGDPPHIYIYSHLVTR